MSKDAINFNDAIGQPIVIGHWYGYSASQGSTITVVIGEAIRLTEQKVTLRVSHRQYFLYGKPTDLPWKGDKPTVSVHPAHLFPISFNLVQHGNSDA